MYAIKLMKALLILLSIICLGLACTKSAQEQSEETLLIGLQDCESAEIDNQLMTLCVDSLVDARCPADVVCVSPGWVITKLTLNIQMGKSFPSIFQLDFLKELIRE